jgi:hypothetical protein
MIPVCMLAYFLFGLFLGFVVHELTFLEGKDVSAEALTSITMFWPFALPDIIFRLLAGRWFSEWQAGHPRHRPMPRVKPREPEDGAE